MSSSEQVGGAILGGLAGFVVGGPVGALIGATAGYSVGGLLNPPSLPTIKAPRLGDLSVQTSTYGASLGRIYGTAPIVGNIFWLENNQLREVVSSKKQGGKGGPTQTVETVQYYATFAISIADTSRTGPIAGVRRIWIGNSLYYDAGSDDLETIIASNLNKNSQGNFRIYDGSADQMPDLRMQADIGVDDCPAYRHTAYLVFYDMPLEDYGNTIQGLQVKVEAVTSQTTQVSHSATYNTGRNFDSAAYVRGPAQMMFDPERLYFAATYSVSSVWNSVTVFPDGRTENRSTGLFRSSSDLEGHYYQALRGDTDLTVSLISGYGGRVRLDDAEYDLENISVLTGGYIYGSNGQYVLYRKGDAALFKLSSTNGIGSYLAGPTGGGDCHCISGTTFYKLLTDGQTVRTYDLEDFSVIEDIVAFDPPLASYTQDLTGISVDGQILYGITNTRVIGYDMVSGEVVIDVAYSTVAEPGTPSIRKIQNGVLCIYYDFDGGTMQMQLYHVRLISGTVELADIVRSEMLLSKVLTESDIDVSLLTDNVRGYRVTEGAIRGAIEPLQGAYPFDVIASGYKIKCVPRGLSSVATIDAGELGAREFGANLQTVIEGPDREMDTQLPKRVSIKYLDPARDYDVNEQIDQRRSPENAKVERIELPLVLTADEAATMARKLLWLRWVERDRYAFALPPTYLGIEPSDVIEITADFGTLNLRIDEVEYQSNGVVKCTAKTNLPAVYSVSATGAQGAVSDGTIGLPGYSEAVLLDLPLLRNQDDEPGFVVAMGSMSQSWPGGVLYKSINGGQTWDDVQAFADAGSFGVISINTTASTVDPHVIDYESEITCNWICGTPQSFTVEDLLNGRGFYALQKVDNDTFTFAGEGFKRCEVLQIANATLNADGTYTFSTMIRGLRGTESNISDDVGCYLVYLEDVDTGWIGAGTDEIAVPRKWRPITFGKTIDTETDIDFAYYGINLRPLSPVELTGYRSGGDWIFTAQPRSRLRSSLWTSGQAVPLGEDAESWELWVSPEPSVIYKSLATRIIASDSLPITYTLEQQIEDFGSAQNAITVSLRMISATAGYGFAALEHLTAAEGFTSLLLHFDGTNGSTDFTDSSASPKTITAVGNAQLSTSQFRFGTASLSLDGTGDYATIPNHHDFMLADDDFTIECWIRLSAYPSGDGGIISLWQTGGNLSWFFGVNSTGRLTFYYSTNGSSGTFSAVTSGAIGTGSFVHVAACRSDGRLRLFIGGDMQYDAANTAELFASESEVVIGAHSGGSAVLPACYIDEMRIIRGEAKYSSDFTPPTAAFS